jgi:hypothetical protein
MANKDAINRVNCGGHCCSKRVGSIMLEAMKEDCLECGLIDPESISASNYLVNQNQHNLNISRIASNIN